MMKAGLPKPFPFALSLLLAGLCLASTEASAQSFTTLRSFLSTPPANPHTNAGGANLNAALVLSSNRLYGTTLFGGDSGNGTVFALNTDGTAFTILHSFTATSGGSPQNIVNVDGANPQATLILAANRLFGTTSFGGTNGNGTVFAINTDGTGFTNLHTFTSSLNNSDGVSPYGGLILSSNTLFGTTTQGGTYGKGTVFALNIDGSGFTTLHSFNGAQGTSPYGGLALSGNTLFGTAIQGGGSDYGTVFAIHTDGTTFTNLHSFTVNEGVSPFATLLVKGDTLYGTTETGGSLGFGTIFAINTDGTGFAILHSFKQNEGWEPQAALILSGNTLYGTATYGGIGQNGNGTVFALNTDGTGFTNLHRFTSTTGAQAGYGVNVDGGFPVGGVILSSNILFGTTHMGGSSGGGTIFSLSFTPQLTLTASGPDLVFMWPMNYAGFDYTPYLLKSATGLGASAVWTACSPGPVAVNGHYMVTNPISGPSQFYRLSQ